MEYEWRCSACDKSGTVTVASESERASAISVAHMATFPPNCITGKPFTFKPSLQWQPVESSRFTHVRYPEDGGWVQVKFNNGTIYQYDAPLSAIEEFMRADSKGAALKMLEAYPYRKVEEA